jgi:hypothetical protein
MATYFYGASGECADCSNDDPCTNNTESITLQSGSSIRAECRLRDVEYVGTQINIVVVGQNAVAVSWDGTSYAKGAEFDLSVSGTLLRIARTSHSGNTFAAIDSTEDISLYSVNTSTLEITETLSQLATGAAGDIRSICFLDDDDVLICSSERTFVGSPNEDTVHFYKGTVTGGGTGMTFSSAISKVYDSVGGNFTHVDIEKVANGQAAALVKYSVGSFTALSTSFIDATGTPSFGTTTVLESGVTVDFSDKDMDESDDGCMILYTVQSTGSPFRNRYLKYNTVGAEFSNSARKRPVGLTSSTTGVGLDAFNQNLYPVTISGTTISMGSPVLNTDITSGSRVRGLNSSTASLYKVVSAEVVACKLT